LKDVWEIMNKSHFDFFPVFEEADNNKLIGLLFRQEIDSAYNKELERFDLTTNLATKISDATHEKQVSIMVIIFYAR